MILFSLCCRQECYWQCSKCLEIFKQKSLCLLVSLISNRLLFKNWKKKHLIFEKIRVKLKIEKLSRGWKLSLFYVAMWSLGFFPDSLSQFTPFLPIFSSFFHILQAYNEHFILIPVYGWRGGDKTLFWFDLGGSLKLEEPSHPTPQMMLPAVCLHTCAYMIWCCGFPHWQENFPWEAKSSGSTLFP